MNDRSDDARNVINFHGTIISFNVIHYHSVIYSSSVMHSPISLLLMIITNSIKSKQFINNDINQLLLLLLLFGYLGEYSISKSADSMDKFTPFDPVKSSIY